MNKRNALFRKIKEFGKIHRRKNGGVDEYQVIQYGCDRDLSGGFISEKEMQRKFGEVLERSMIEELFNF